MQPWRREGRRAAECVSVCGGWQEWNVMSHAGGDVTTGSGPIN